MRSYFPEQNALIFYLLGKKAGGGGGGGDVPPGNWYYKVTDKNIENFTDYGVEQTQNAVNIYDYFRTQLGWNITSVCAMLGNIHAESGINPGLIEEGGGTTSAGAGRGLVQWTPASDLYNVLDAVYGSHDDWYNGAKQIRCIYAEYEQTTGAHNWGIDGQWYKSTLHPEYNLTFPQFASNELNKDITYLVGAWCWEYERPGAPRMEARLEYAQHWLNYFNKG